MFKISSRRREVCNLSVVSCVAHVVLHCMAFCGNVALFSVSVSSIRSSNGYFNCDIAIRFRTYSTYSYFAMQLFYFYFFKNKRSALDHFRRAKGVSDTPEPAAG